MKIEKIQCLGCGAPMPEFTKKCVYCRTNHRIERTPQQPLNNWITSGVFDANYYTSTGIVWW